MAAFCYTEIMLDIIAEVAGWVATILRASGMLAKKPLAVKLLVSGGNALWLANGIMKGNVPLIASNAICLVIMAVELIRGRKKSKPSDEPCDLLVFDCSCEPKNDTIEVGTDVPGR